MRLLIDECLPRALKRPLQEHTCRTVQEMGWSGKKNGELLSLAETEFDALLTMDQGFEHQQNLSRRRIAISPIVPAALKALGVIGLGQVVRIGN